MDKSEKRANGWINLYIAVMVVALLVEIVLLCNRSFEYADEVARFAGCFVLFILLSGIWTYVKEKNHEILGRFVVMLCLALVVVGIAVAMICGVM